MTFPGPPPRRPLEPRYVHTTHVLHLLLTIITFGMWAIVWVVLAVVHRSQNESMRRDYEKAYARWEFDLWAWEEARRSRGG